MRRIQPTEEGRRRRGQEEEGATHIKDDIPTIINAAISLLPDDR